MIKKDLFPVSYFRHLTPRGEGGISSFLLNCHNRQNFISDYFQTFSGKSPTIDKSRFYYGKLFDSKKELIDEIILSVSNDNELEIHSHGGNISTREIIKFLLSINFQQMDDNIFQKLSTNYHYQHALKNITTVNEYEFIKNQIYQFNKIKSQLSSLDSEKITTLLRKMIDGWNQEKLNRRRANICLVGIPNAGKSSLINAITGKKRSLVSSQAKTTRDTVTENLQTHGYRIKIIDTAGLHKPDNFLDAESVKQTLYYISQAEIILWLHDSTLPFSTDETQQLKEIIALYPTKPIWLILTKTDIQAQFDLKEEGSYFQKNWSVSSQSGAGLELLIESLIQFLFPTTKNFLDIAAISEQMAIEITEFLQKVDLQPAKHKMLVEFFSQILNCVPE